MNRIFALLTTLLFVTSVAAQCKEECKKAQKACLKLAATAPSIANPQACQQEYNRCMSPCKTTSRLIGQKLN